MQEKPPVQEAPGIEETLSRRQQWNKEISECNSFDDLQAVGERIYKEMSALLAENSKLSIFHEYKIAEKTQPNSKEGVLQQGEVLGILSAIRAHPQNIQKSDIAPFRGLASEFGTGH